TPLRGRRPPPPPPCIPEPPSPQRRSASLRRKRTVPALHPRPQFPANPGVGVDPPSHTAISGSRRCGSLGKPRTVEYRESLSVRCVVAGSYHSSPAPVRFFATAFAPRECNSRAKSFSVFC